MTAAAMLAASTIETKTGWNRLPRRGQASFRKRCVRMKTPWLPNPNDARGQIGRVHYDSDRQREFRRTFERARFGADKGSRLERSNRRRQTTPACAIRERH